MNTGATIDGVAAFAVVTGHGYHHQVALSALQPRLIFGRDPSCDVVLEDRAISRRHVVLKLVDAKVYVEDVSSNGTLINGTLVRRKSIPVSDNFIVTIGGYQIVVQVFARESLADGTPSPEEKSSVGGERYESGLVSAKLRRKIHEQLVEHLDLRTLERAKLNSKLLRAKVDMALREVCAQMSSQIPVGTDTNALILELRDEAVGLGPLESLLADDAISEIMVVDPNTIYVERAGRIVLTEKRFTDVESVRSTLERIVTPLGRRIDESSPLLDARLPDGSRVNAIIPPLATRGPCITIRKFSRKPLTMESLLAFKSLSERMAVFLDRSVRAQKNIIVAGGTGSGKTTLLNVLSSSIPPDQRVVTIEDAAELQLQQPHVVTLEARPPNIEGKGAVTIRDLLKNAMRMRPDRVIVGECRGGEALDMLMAMNTGHDGSMTTTHANNPEEALRRIETLTMMSGVDLAERAIRELIAYSVDLVVHQARFSDGSRKVTSVSEVVDIDDHGGIRIREIFGYRQTGTGRDGVVQGEFYETGYLPSFLAEFMARNLVSEGELFL